MLLRWNLHKGTCVITTSTKAERVGEALAAASTSFELSPAEVPVAAIDAAGASGKAYKHFWQATLVAPKL
eukprot:SAG22_NODE_2376_length_2642_cov_11.644514_2_plen_70_part_00